MKKFLVLGLLGTFCCSGVSAMELKEEISETSAPSMKRQKIDIIDAIKRVSKGKRLTEDQLKDLPDNEREAFLMIERVKEQNHSRVDTVLEKKSE